MRIRVNGSELNSAMRIIKKCINPKVPKLANVEITHTDTALTLRGTNGTFSASVSIPLLGGNGESFCVDGDTFARVCAINSREIELSTEGGSCVIKGSGRTRLPMLAESVPEISDVTGKQVIVSAASFASCCEQIKHAIATDQTRIVLTGALVEADGYTMRMTALDGFRLASESMQCSGDNIKIIVPGAFLAMVASAIDMDDRLTLTTDGGSLTVDTGFAKMKSVLLTGEYPDVQRIMPTAFKTECLVKKSDVLEALKSGGIILFGEKLIKISVSQNVMTVTSNSEMADYEAEIGCDTTGDPVVIAFNSDYLEKALSSMTTEEVVLHMNSATSPMVITGRDGDGKRLVLPVRTR